MVGVHVYKCLSSWSVEPPRRFELIASCTFIVWQLSKKLIYFWRYHFQGRLCWNWNVCCYLPMLLYNIRRIPWRGTLFPSLFDRRTDRHQEQNSVTLHMIKEMQIVCLFIGIDVLLNQIFFSHSIWQINIIVSDAISLFWFLIWLWNSIHFTLIDIWVTLSNWLCLCVCFRLWLSMAFSYWRQGPSILLKLMNRIVFDTVFRLALSLSKWKSI